MRGKILIPLFCLLVGIFLLTFQVSKATTSEPSIVQVTHQQQIHLIMTALTEAINDPSNFNLDMVSVAFPAEQWESVKEKIRHVMAAYRADSSLVYRLTFKPHAIVEFKDGGYGSMVEALVEFGNMVRNKTIEVNFQPGKHCPIITNLDEVLDEVVPFLEESASELADFAGATLSKGGERTSILSNNLLLPAYIYGSYTRFTSSVSHAEYGHDIFSRPYGLHCVVYIDPPMPELSHEIVVVSDPNDRRVTATSNNPNDPGQPNWFQQIGSFDQPTAIAYLAQQWYIPDDSKVRVYYLDWSGTLTQRDTLNGTFGDIVDLDAAIIPNASTYELEVAVLDRSTKIISIFDYYGNFQRSFPSYCSDPTALCYTRNYITGYKTHYLYVVDNYSKQIMRLDSWDIEQPYVSVSGIFPSDAQLTSAAKDAYSTMYVLDNYNSVCYVIVSGELVATFGVGSGCKRRSKSVPCGGIKRAV